MQERRNSIANALELRLSYINPSTYEMDSKPQSLTLWRYGSVLAFVCDKRIPGASDIISDITTWISNNITFFLWDIITYPYTNFHDGLTKLVFNNGLVTWHVITHPCLRK